MPQTHTAQTDTVHLPEKEPAAVLISMPEFKYHFEQQSVWKKKDSFEGYQHQQIIAAINRVDSKHLQRLDSFLVPDRYIDSVNEYMPFAFEVPALKEVKKVILFSYQAQAFAAYEYGRLILSGPTNMGKKNSLTPTGLFFCNWKSKETRSTVDEEWILKWNFNVSNRGGVGFHEYALPGYPASHSCLRLWAEHAEYLYYWAEQWKLSKDEKLLASGTPVVIFGAYPFGQPRPWFALAKDNKALAMDAEMLAEVLKPYLQEILDKQKERSERFPELPPTDTTAVMQ